MGVVRWRAATTELVPVRLAGDGDDGWNDGSVGQDRAEERRRDERSG